jgi:hypothetical protein
MPTNPDKSKSKSKLSRKKKKGDDSIASDTDYTIQDGADTTCTASPAAAETQQTILADHLKTLLTSDTTLIQTLADTIASILINSTDLLEKVTDKIKSSMEEEISQQVYQSVSMDLERQTKLITSLQEQQATLIKQLSAMEGKLDEHEQYSRRNCLLIHGLPETHKENTTTIAIKTIAERLKVSLSEDDIDRSHRLGTKQKLNTSDEDVKQSRPIIVKFCSYAKRDKVFKCKSKLRKTGIVITENLTAKRMSLLNAAKHHQSVESAWSIDGRIQCITTSERYMNIKNMSDLDKL